MSTYRATFERDEDGYWFVDFPEVPGCHTQGKSLAVARKRAVEALQSFLEDDTASVEEDLVLPEGAGELVASVLDLRVEAERTAEALRKGQAAAVQGLLDASLSMREAGELLGVSYQRVHQVAQKAQLQRKPPHARGERSAKKVSTGRSRAREAEKLPSRQ